MCICFQWQPFKIKQTTPHYCCAFNETTNIYTPSVPNMTLVHLSTAIFLHPHPGGLTLVINPACFYLPVDMQYNAPDDASSTRSEFMFTWTLIQICSVMSWQTERAPAAGHALKYTHTHTAERTRSYGNILEPLWHRMWRHMHAEELPRWG